MTEHPIEELERQLVAARGRATEASQAVTRAEAALRSARVDSTGLVGHKVSFKRVTYKDRTGTDQFFLVEKMSRWGRDVVEGRTIRKDGSLGTSTKSANVKDLVDHGLYEEPKP